jgi:hypothetical protein
MKMVFYLPIEMLDYNQNFKNFMSLVYNEKCLGESHHNGI